MTISCTENHTIYSGQNWTIHNMDALNMSTSGIIQPESVDTILCDPPYSSGGTTAQERQNGASKKYISDGSCTSRLVDFDGDNRDQRSYTTWLAMVLALARPAVKLGGIVMVFTDWRQLPATTDAVQSAGYIWRGIIPWHKPANRKMAGRFSKACEYIVYASHGKLGRTTVKGLPCPEGFYSQTPPYAKKRIHPTEKPVDMLRYMLTTTPENGTVMDLFCGSGSTGEAAISTNRKFIGFEISSHYAKTAADRLTEYTKTH